MSDITYIGIDNGITGAIAELNKNGLVLEPMPIYSDGKRKRVNVEELDFLLSIYKGANTIVAYESVAGSRNASAIASMTDSFARVETVLILGGFRRQPVTARRWQKTYWSVPKMPKGKKFDTKAASLNKAKELWPAQDWRRNDKCKIPFDGFTDAALIAEYVRRLYSGWGNKYET